MAAWVQGVAGREADRGVGERWRVSKEDTIRGPASSGSIYQKCGTRWARRTPLCRAQTRCRPTVLSHCARDARAITRRAMGDGHGRRATGDVGCGRPMAAGRSIETRQIAETSLPVVFGEQIWCMVHWRLAIGVQHVQMQSAQRSESVPGPAQPAAPGPSGIRRAPRAASKRRQRRSPPLNLIPRASASYPVSLVLTTSVRVRAAVPKAGGRGRLSFALLATPRSGQGCGLAGWVWHGRRPGAVGDPSSWVRTAAPHAEERDGTSRAPWLHR